MKKVFAFLLTFLIAISLASCKVNQPKDILEAWTGEYTDEKFKESVSEYQTNYNPIGSDDRTEISSVSFKIDFDISSCAVHKVSLVDNNDIDAELQGSIYLHVETSFEDKEITVDTDWWYDSNDWTKDYTVWSYLVCVNDTEGAKHYYYFRTDYSSTNAENDL